MIICKTQGDIFKFCLTNSPQPKDIQFTFICDKEKYSTYSIVLHVKSVLFDFHTMCIIQIIAVSLCSLTIFLSFSSSLLISVFHHQRGEDTTLLLPACFPVNFYVYCQTNHVLLTHTHAHTLKAHTHTNRKPHPAPDLHFADLA